MSDETVKGYKGFNEKLQCTPNGKVFQYEIGKEYSEAEANLCSTGFHFCENPLDVLRYYQPATGRYAEVAAEDVSLQTDGDTKRVAKKLKIVAELKLKSMIDLGVKFILSKTDKTSGNSSPAATSGGSSHAATSGESSPAATSGDYSRAATSGEDSIAASIGRAAKAKAAIGSWIVLAEYEPDSRKVLTVKTVKVDGKKIKADTFYELKKGKFVKAGE